MALKSHDARIYVHAEEQLIRSAFALLISNELLFPVVDSPQAADLTVLVLTTPAELSSLLAQTRPQIVVSTGPVDRGVLDEANVPAFLGLRSSARHLGAAIESVIEGRRYYEFGSDADALSLTGECRQILRKLSEGDSAKVIAISLGLTTQTVRYHIRNLLEKFSARTEAEMVLKAAKDGWI